MNHEDRSSPDLIRGDKFTGLSIAGETDRLYQFTLDGQSVEIRQTKWRQQTAGLSGLELAFRMSGPVRFRIDVLVPEDCRNACVVLNGQMLIGWFAPDPPADVPGIRTSACQDGGSPVSTLRPGQFQSISFRWQDQDLLRFCWVRQEPAP